MSKQFHSVSDPVEEGSAFQDHTDRFPRDQKLRNHGWRVYSRPSKGEALWEKDGEVLPFSHALDLISLTTKKQRS